ncbi:EpsG family protein [Fructilactobacillus vespulae]|uniref:EpsG family protein n=1 Tax=Fructilactobacillus vespulae TaxID=1249630 RepID=UPI0039B52CAB
MIEITYGIAYIGLIFLFLIIGLKIKNDFFKIFLFSFDFLISFLSFFVHPAKYHFFDTIRFNFLLDTARSINVKNSYFDGLNWLLHFSEYKGQPLVAFYIWIYTFFENNGFFFFGTTFLFISIVIVLLLLSKKYFSLTNNSVVLTLFFFFGSFNMFFEVEGVRNFLSFIILTLCLFIDIFNSDLNKRKIYVYLGYLIAILMHPFSIIFILLRFSLLFINEFKLGNLIKYIFFEIVLTYNLLVLIFVNLLSNISNLPFVGLIIDKMQHYIAGQTNFKAHAGLKEIIFTIFLFFILSINFYLFKKYFEQYLYLSIVKYNEYIFVIILFIIGSTLSVQLFLRSIMLLLFMMLPLIGYMFSLDSNSQVKILGHKITMNKLILYFKIINILTALIMMIHWYLQTNRFVMLIL